ncbi:SUN domain-containing protein 3 [Columba livia]|uniref:SUN domain-containing protein 3 n=1 Tax=Columba livia TaxID=8932 RepID=UPI0031BB1E42
MLVTCTSAGTRRHTETVEGLNGKMKTQKATMLVLILGLLSFGIYDLGQLGKESLWSTAAQLQDLSKTLSLPDQLHKLQEQLYHLRWSTKDVAEQALQEGLKQAKLPGFTGRAVQEIINQALENLVEIQVPMPDYALKSAGAAVIHSRTSPSLRNAKAKLFFYSLPLMDYMRSPELILEPENYPGNCWPFPGSQGHVFIKLPVPVIPRAVTMDHVSGTAFHGESISGAPKDFAVYGFKEEHEEQGMFLGQFTFLVPLNPSQTFQLKNELPVVVNYIRLQVLSNWGHPDYTCLYRFRVHGDPPKDGGDVLVSSVNKFH